MALGIILLLLTVMVALVVVAIYEICCQAGVQPPPQVAHRQVMVILVVGVIIQPAGHILTPALAGVQEAVVVITVPVAAVSVALAGQVVSQELL